MKAKILIVDDERMTRDAMTRILEKKYTCLSAADPELALGALEANPDITLLLTDYKMPVMNGIELIKAAKQKNPALGAILITAFGEIELAVEAMKEGADDFLTKPITDLDQLYSRVDRVLRLAALAGSAASVAEPSAAKKATADGFGAFTGNSPAMGRVYALIRRIAPTPATVLIQGPSGTGKELVAHALHDLSPRKAKPFVAVECSAFPSALLESELFGYMPGTFTGGLKDGKKGCIESADGGTLFLDEIGEIDKATQTTLLRVLETKSVRRIGGSEERKVDFRLVAATNRDLKAMVDRGEFREDLYYRLNVINIDIPALKDRPGDVALIAERYLREFAKQYTSPVTGLAPDALSALETYPWPGNVRELRNVIERMVVLASGPLLVYEDLPEEVRGIRGEGLGIRGEGRDNDDSAETLSSQPSTINNQPATSSPSPSLAESEKQQILAALKAAGGNKTKAADALGISRRTLHRKLKEWSTP